jgi:hypothetical protein
MVTSDAVAGSRNNCTTVACRMQLTRPAHYGEEPGEMIGHLAAASG